MTIRPLFYLALVSLTFAQGVVTPPSLAQERYLDLATGTLLETCAQFESEFFQGEFAIQSTAEGYFVLVPWRLDFMASPNDPSQCSLVVLNPIAQAARDELLYSLHDLRLIDSAKPELQDDTRRYDMHTKSSLKDLQFRVLRVVQTEFLATLLIEDTEAVTVTGPDLSNLPFPAALDAVLQASVDTSVSGSVSYDPLQNILSIQFDEGSDEGNYRVELLFSDPAAGLFDARFVLPVEYAPFQEDGTPTPPVIAIPLPPGNFQPTFTAPNTLAVNEDAGAQHILVWATSISPGPASEAAQTVSFTVTNDNNSLFAAQPAVAANGDLSFTAADDAFGVASVFVTATDSGGASSAGHTLTLTVNSDNDDPAFTAPALVPSSNEDAGAQTLNAWLTGLSTGAANEADTLSFTVTNDNNALFAVQPAITSDGTLSYTAADNASGVAVLTINVSDGAGGTAGLQNSTLTVAAVNDGPTPDATGTVEVSTFEDALSIVYIDADDIEGNDFTFELSSASGQGTFYFPKNNADVSGRISSLTFSIAGSTDSLADFFEPATVDDSSFTTYIGSSSLFSSGFVFGYVPDADKGGFTETVSVRFKDTSGETSAVTTYNINVAALNDAPLISGDGGAELAGDTNYGIVFDGVFLNDTFEAVPLTSNLSTATIHNLGLTIIDADIEGINPGATVRLILESTLPTPACASTYLDSGGGTVIPAFPATVTTSYSAAQRIASTLTMNCSSAESGTITVKMNDFGNNGECAAPHPDAALGEVLLPSGCTRVSEATLNLNFAP